MRWMCTPTFLVIQFAEQTCMESTHYTLLYSPLSVCKRNTDRNLDSMRMDQVKMSWQTHSLAQVYKVYYIQRGGGKAEKSAEKLKGIIFCPIVFFSFGRASSWWNVSYNLYITGKLERNTHVIKGKFYFATAPPFHYIFAFSSFVANTVTSCSSFWIMHFFYTFSVFFCLDHYMNLWCSWTRLNKKVTNLATTRYIVKLPFYDAGKSYLLW